MWHSSRKTDTSPAEDLSRYINGQVVSTREPPAYEKLTKWAKRKPAVASLVAALTLALSAMVIGSLLYGNWMKNRADELADANQTIQTTLQNEAKAKEQAQSNLEKAVRSIRESHIAVSNQPQFLLGASGTQSVQLALGQQAISLVEELEINDSTDASARTIALANFEVGRANRDMAKYESAIEAFDLVVKKIEANQLNKNDPDFADLIANAEFEIGYCYAHLGNKVKAKELYDEAKKTFEIQLTTFPDYVPLKMGLATAINNLALFADNESQALALFEKAAQIRKELSEHPEVVGNFRFEKDYAGSLHNLAMLYKNKKPPELATALTYIAESNELQSRLVQRYPQIDKLRHGFAITKNIHGEILRRIGKREEGSAQNLEALSIIEEIARANPDVPSYARECVDSHMQLSSGQPPETTEFHVKKAIELIGGLIERSDGEDSDSSLLAARIHQYYAGFLFGQNRTEDAKPQMEKAAKLLVQLQTKQPSNDLYHKFLGDFVLANGNFFLSSSPTDAIEQWNKITEHEAELPNSSIESESWISRKIKILEAMFNVYKRKEKFKEAESTILSAIAIAPTAEIKTRLQALKAELPNEEAGSKRD